MNYKSRHWEADNIKLVCHFHVTYKLWKFPQNFLWELGRAQVLLSENLIYFMELAVHTCSVLILSLCNLYW